MAAELQPLSADPDAKKADAGGAPKEKDPAPTIIPKVETPIQVVPRNTEPPKVRGAGHACLPARLPMTLQARLADVCVTRAAAFSFLTLVAKRRCSTQVASPPPKSPSPPPPETPSSPPPVESPSPPPRSPHPKHIAHEAKEKSAAEKEKRKTQKELMVRCYKMSLVLDEVSCVGCEGSA